VADYQLQVDKALRPRLHLENADASIVISFERTNSLLCSSGCYIFLAASSVSVLFNVRLPPIQSETRGTYLSRKTGCVYLTVLDEAIREERTLRTFSS
jgi:hypothetical protein